MSAAISSGHSSWYNATNNEDMVEGEIRKIWKYCIMYR